MKKRNQNAENEALTKLRPGWIKDFTHTHAANCGHKSYVHGNHIDYEVNGKFHVVENGKTYYCDGPNAKVIPFPKKQTR